MTEEQLALFQQFQEAGFAFSIIAPSMTRVTIYADNRLVYEEEDHCFETEALGVSYEGFQLGRIETRFSDEEEMGSFLEDWDEVGRPDPEVDLSFYEEYLS